MGFVRPFFDVEMSVVILLSEDLWTNHMKNDMYALGKGLTIQLLAEKPRMMALAEKITVARYFGRRYTASRYTFSPPERGNMVPNSSHIKSPQNDRKKQATQSNKDAPTDPTDLRMVDGVEKIPVPIIRPMLETNSIREGLKMTRRSGYMSIVQLNTPKWRPIPPAVSGINILSANVDSQRIRSNVTYPPRM